MDAITSFLVNFELKTSLTVFFYEFIGSTIFIYNTTMGQDKNSKTKQDRIAKQEITRKCRKFIDERDLHNKRIEVRLERKKKE